MTAAVARDSLPARYVSEFTAIARAQQFDVEALLRAAGIDADTEITGAECDRFYHLLVQKMDDVCLGVHRHRTPVGYVRLLLNYLVQGATLREALELAIEFFALSDRQLRGGSAAAPSRVAAELHIDTGAGLASFQLYSSRDESSAISDLHDMASLQRVLAHLIGAPLTLREVCVAAAADGHWQVYADVLDCPIRFGYGCNVLRFATDYLDYPLRQDAQSVRAALTSGAYEMLFPRAPQRLDTDIVAAVKVMIGTEFARGGVGLDEVALRLALPPRSLRWALVKAGTSFQQIKNDCLRDTAIAYLRRDDLSAAQVAELLGFSDAGAFNRSFKRLTGVPPGAYRARRRSH